MKCEIQWIDEKGRRTPDDNDAVAIACITFFSCGGEIIEQKRYPICQCHLDKMPTKPFCLNGGTIKYSEWTKEELNDN